MYMSRDIMHCAPGKAKEIVERFRKMSDAMKSKGYPAVRTYTDVCGERYWTVVMEQDVKSLDELAEMARTAMADPGIAGILAGYHQFVLEGRRELYRVESV